MLRRELGPFPLWLWLVAGAIAVWYLASREAGWIRPGNVQEIVSDAIDEPHERAELVRGVATGLISGVLSFYLLKRWGKLQ